MTESLQNFLRLTPADLPDAPFQLDAATTVIDKQKFLRALQREVQSAIAHQGPKPYFRRSALHSTVKQVLLLTQ